MSDLAARDGRMSDGMRGFLLAFGAYALWGALPLYLKVISQFPATEIVVYRVVWSVPVALILLLALGQWNEMKNAIFQPRMLAMASLTATLITVNWTVYIWAVAHDQMVEAALGYYINPLFNVLLGALFLSEKLNRVQWVAISLAALAVVVLAVDAGGLPWVSLVLPLTFAFYGFFRKSLPVAPLPGFTLEVLILSIPAAIYWVYLAYNGEQHFTTVDISTTLLLMLAGPVTAIPLILYAFGAKLLRYTTLGLMQYMTPSVLLLMAVFLFGEPLSSTTLIAFILIWAGLILYTWSSLVEHNRSRKS